MAESPVTVTLRIPGKWSHPRELVERLPEGCRLTPEALTLADKTQFEFCPMPPDEQFAQIFRSSCRQEASAEELETVDRYTVNIGLSGPGGSLDSARAIMRAAVPIIQAGGAGVFIDNSALAHGGQQWIEMANDGGPDALSFAFVALISNKEDLWTMGMHVLGLRDIRMKRADADKGFDIIEVIRYLAAGDKPVEDRHIIADLDGPRFQAFTHDDTEFKPGTPMHNPFGKLKLVSMHDIAEAN